MKTIKKHILGFSLSAKIHKMKIILLVLFSLPFMSFMSMLFDPTPPTGYSGSPCDGSDCSSCHSDFVVNSGIGSSSITSNIPAGGYIGGNTYSITVTINYTGRNFFNFELSPQKSNCTSFGTLTSTPSTIVTTSGGLQYIRGNNHIINPNTASWTFNWTAPIAGSGCGTSYACFNAANGTGDETGDYIYVASLAACEPGPLGIAISNSTNVACRNVCNGTATVSATGGTPPYTYSWNSSPTQTTATATGLCAGSYTVTVTDGVSATQTATVAITQPAAVLSTTMGSTNQTNVTPDGTATATPAGGTSPYTYVWNPGGQTTQTAVGLAAGTYTVTVTDAHACTTTNTVSIISTVGVNSLDISSELNVYPNPSSGLLFVELNSLNNESYSLQLINLTGQIVYHKDLSFSAGKNITTISTDAIEEGLYILQLSSEVGVKRIPILITK